MWLVHLKPLLTLILSLIFGILSIVILYAQIANVFGFEHNLIYDIVNLPELNGSSASYFIGFNVRITLTLL